MSRARGAPEPPPLLELREVAKTFRGRGREARAVDGVTLRIRESETLGLVGESGAGKSTLARLAVGLLRPDRGRLLFRGRDPGREGRASWLAFRRSVQMVFQDPHASLNPRMSVGDALAEPMRVHGLGPGGAARRERVRELLARVGLDPATARRHPHELSGGQCQRVGIARALAVEPELLVLDEPVTALDVSVQARILNLLAELQDELGLAYLFIAHDLAVVRRVSHRVAVMLEGRVVEEGSADEIFRAPSHPHTRLLLASVPRLERPAGKRVSEGAGRAAPGDPAGEGRRG